MIPAPGTLALDRPLPPYAAPGKARPGQTRMSAASELQAIIEEAKDCRRCPLYAGATQLVFGEGPADAPLVLVGEQPGDREDRTGRPFVGPAGRVLDEALAAARIDRERVYVTNAVKHFKHEERGRRRIHKSPNRYEIDRCRWWLDKELALIRPRMVVALGASAASALLGRRVILREERGRLMPFAPDARAFATVHPAALLRVRDEAGRHAAFDAFVRDLSLVRETLPDL